NQNTGRTAGDDGVHIHLIEHGAFVFDAATGHGFQLRHQVFNAFAAMSIDEPDHYIFTAIVAADSFAQHAVGFSHAGRIAEEKFEDALGFFRSASFLSQT